VTRHERRRADRVARRLASYGVPVRKLEVSSHDQVVPVLLHAFPNESLFRPISVPPGRRSARP
jgi:outer membrane protein OmpA-like peptidoglycan-associated protein